jgi:hypothetical protein
VGDSSSAAAIHHQLAVASSLKIALKSTPSSRLMSQ